MTMQERENNVDKANENGTKYYVFCAINQKTHDKYECNLFRILVDMQ